MAQEWLLARDDARYRSPAYRLAERFLHVARRTAILVRTPQCHSILLGFSPLALAGLFYCCDVCFIQGVKDRA